MEQMSILLMLLMLSGWIKHSGATNCTVYLSSQPLTLNLLCPSVICRLKIINTRECTNGCSSCNIDDCNKVHNLCDTSSPQGQPSRGHAVHSNEHPITCTFVQTMNTGLRVTCQKGEYQLTFSNTTACNKDLGINCNSGDPATCIRIYNFCMEPQPNPCLPLSDTVSTTALNQYTNSVSIQTHIKEVTFTIHSVKPIYTQSMVQVNMCPSPTISLKPQILGGTNVLNISSLTNTSYHSVPTHSPVSETCIFTVPTLHLNKAIPATGALVGLLTVSLVVVTTGWIYTCSRMTKLGLRSQNIRNVTDHELSLNNNPAYKTWTIFKRNIAYEDTSINMDVPDESQIETNQLEPIYEIAQLSSSETNTIIKRPDSEKDEDEYDKLKRDAPSIN